MDWTIKNHLGRDANGNLKIGDVSALGLVKTYGTPVLVINEQRMRDRFKEFYRALKKRYEKVKIYYAVKANPCLAILRILLSEGAGLEVVSEYELLNALKSGARSEQIVFNGVNKSLEELKTSVKNKILINVDSFSELQKLEKIARQLDKVATICIRVNPAVILYIHEQLTTGAVTSQFGVYLPEAKKVFGYAHKSKHISLEGVHIHIGSQLTTLQPFREAANKIFQLMAELKRNGISLKYINFGGGLGVRYEGVSKLTGVDEYAETIVSTVHQNIERHQLEKPYLLFEPGRYILADAGIYLLKVGVIKTPPQENKWIIVDGGSNILLRAALGVYKFKMILANKANMKAAEKVNVAGPLCFGGDVIGREVKLPPVQEGDILAVLCAGAYTDSISHQYNLRPRPPIVLVNNSEHYLIKEAERYKDLVGKDIIPDRLK